MVDVAGAPQPQRTPRGALPVAVVTALAGAAVWARYRVRRAEREHPPIGRFIEVDGVRLHYLERGRGMPVVLLHGDGSMIEDFVTSGLVDLVADRYRVLVFDRPGSGYSTRPRGRAWTPAAQADLLQEALQRLGAQPALVVGHSWGSLVAVELALRHPSAVAGLVLLAGYYFPTVRPDMLLPALVSVPGLGTGLRHVLVPALGRALIPLVLRWLFGPAPVPARFRSFPFWLALRPGQLRAAAVEALLVIPAAFALRHRYRALQMPLLIMAGEGDRVVGSGRHSAQLWRATTGSELVIVPGAGHMVHHAVPEGVLAAIDRVRQRAA